MGKRKTGMKEEHQLNTMSDGAFTDVDMVAQAYESMKLEHHEKDANGEPIPHDDEEGTQEINEVESAYKDKIAAYKAKGGTVKKYTGPDKDKVRKAVSGFKAKLAKTQKIQSAQDEKEKADKEQQDEAHMGMAMDKDSVKKRVSMFQKLRDKKASQGYQKTGLASEDYGQDHADFYAGKDPKKKKMIVPAKAPKYQHGTGVAGQKGNTGRNEEVSKTVSKLNKILESRKNVIPDGQGGAGFHGTDELVKNYKKATPGQEPLENLKEGNITQDSGDDFKKFEHMVEYLMGVSVKHPESFQMFPIGESGKMRIEYEHGPVATICETDVTNFFGPNTDMEQFVDMAKGFGVSVTTPENSFVVGDNDQQGIVQEKLPGQYAEEFSKRYTTGGIMDQMKANIEALAKRI
tara:strand:+ start:1 stop:1212 length:1212 start_codon:yes stop_codon:yes gene_type:complete